MNERFKEKYRFIFGMIFFVVVTLLLMHHDISENVYEKICSLDLLAYLASQAAIEWKNKEN